MGNDSPLAVLSNKNKTLYHYFKQLFAQVTNPPIDPIREELVTSLVSLHRAEAEPARRRRDEPAAAAGSRRSRCSTSSRWRRSATSSATPTASSSRSSSTSPIRSPGASEAIEARLASLAAQAEDAVRAGYSILIISDRKLNRDQVAIPALLALSAIHQHLVNKGLRTSTGLVVETGSAREVHHFALLGGYGAEAVHPYLALRDADRSRRATSCSARTSTAREGVQELHQGDRQGAEEGDVQDGHLDLHVVHRRADLRGGGSFAARWSTSTSPARPRTSRASAYSKSPRRRSACIARLSADDAGARRRARCRRRIRLARARRGAHVDARTRSRSCSMPRAPASYRHLQGIRADHQRSVAAAHDFPRAVRIQASTAARPCRSRRSSPRPRSSSASPPARCRSGRSRPRRTRRSPSR